MQQLNKKGIIVSTYNKVDAEPTNIHVLEALSLCKEEKCDFIIGIGGGSCIDAAKAVAVLYTNGGEVEDYVQKDIEIENNPLPLIAIPTTSGTGSEVTSVAVITNKNRCKMMMKHPSFIPKVAIIDPVLTSSLPPQITAATGIDALCHAIEAYISKFSQPLTDVLALSAIESIMKYLRIAYEDGHNMEARSDDDCFLTSWNCIFECISYISSWNVKASGSIISCTAWNIKCHTITYSVRVYENKCSEKVSKIGRNLNKDLYSNSDCYDKKLRIPNLKEYGIDEIEFENAISKMASDAIESGSQLITHVFHHMMKSKSCIESVLIISIKNL